MSAASAGVSALAMSSELATPMNEVLIAILPVLRAACLMKRPGASGAGPQSVLEAEYIKHRRGRLVLELRVVDDLRRVLPRASQHRDVLLAIDCEADGRCAKGGSGIEAPQLLQGPAVIGR